MRTLAAGLALAALLAGEAEGQVIQVSATSLSARHELLGNPLIGASITRHLTSRRLRLSFDISRGTAERVGTTCAGLIPPGGCPPEELNDKSTLVAAGVGADMGAIRTGRLSFAGTIDGRAAWLDVKTHGQASGDRIAANKRYLELMAGGKLRWRLAERWVLEGGADVGTMHPLTLVHVEDGYSPLEDAFGFHRFSIGAIWTARR